MRDEFDQYLQHRYKEMYDCGGIATGDGWFRLIDSLFANIKWRQEWLKKTGKKFKPVKVVQVKEKFGTLRFYIDGGDDHIRGLIDQAETMSNHICEECGDVGHKRGKGWIKVLCDKHAKDKDYHVDMYVMPGDTVSLFTQNGFEPVSVVNIINPELIEVLTKNNTTLQVKPLVVGGVNLNAYIV
jgi:hypothetical protein